jgi:hypothetical protein
MVGAVADVLALHARHRGQHREHDPGRVVRALEFVCEELQPDIARLQAMATTAPPSEVRAKVVAMT